MTEYVVTAVDTTQIQSYIFGSNKLRDNIGGSQLVELATHQWVYEALPASSNVADPVTGSLDDSRMIGSVDAEIVYAGGGNTVILFKSIELARAFAGAFTRRVLRDAPGLEVVVAHRRFNWQQEALAMVVSRLLGVDLARKKQNRTPSLPLLGLGVTKPCTATGLVATHTLDGDPVSREIRAKNSDSIQSQSQTRLIEKLPRIKQSNWTIPHDFDELGRIKGDESYIAVVHADGNGIGKRVEAIARRHHTPAQNREYIRAMREFSQSLERAATQALNRVVDLMAEAFIADETIAQRHEWSFPLRPIVFGGDDVTFVSVGSYGLALAVEYLTAFEEATRREPAFGGQPAYACAGVAIVKSHYPFARAYRLSEQLCRAAKQRLKEEQLECSAIDWHIAMSGITGSLTDIRQREYTTNRGRLYVRPLLLGQAARSWREWSVFKEILDQLTREDGEWFERRNKVKALREALRRGSVEDFLRIYRIESLPKAAAINVANYERTGWAGDRCVYFDTIELMDLFTDLQRIVAQVKSVPER